MRAFHRSDFSDERAICNAVAPEKDVDGFHIENIGRLCLDQKCLMPATPTGVWEMLKRSGNSILVHFFCQQKQGFESCEL